MIYFTHTQECLDRITLQRTSSEVPERVVVVVVVDMVGKKSNFWGVFKGKLREEPRFFFVNPVARQNAG